MTTQQTQITSDELHAATGAKFGLIIGRLTVENLELRNLLTAAQNRSLTDAAELDELRRKISQLEAEIARSIGPGAGGGTNAGA